MENDIIFPYGPKQVVRLDASLNGRTKQAHQKETDINYILAKYTKTGILEHAEKYASRYGFASSDDLFPDFPRGQRGP